MRGMKSNVVFASVRRNWELSRDGFIVRGVPPFFRHSVIDLSKYRSSRRASCPRRRETRQLIRIAARNASGNYHRMLALVMARLRSSRFDSREIIAD